MCTLGRADISYNSLRHMVFIHIYRSSHSRIEFFGFLTLGKRDLNMLAEHTARTEKSQEYFRAVAATATAYEP